MQRLLDVRGAFLHGEFEKKQQPIYMKELQEFENFYPLNVVLPLLKTLYGMKQATYAFWQKLLLAFLAMLYQHSKADPCI